MKQLLLISFLLISLAGKTQTPTFSDLLYKDSVYWYHDKLYSGPVLDYYENGKISYKGQIKNGIQDSVWFSYNKKGKLILVVAFYKGKQTYDWSYSLRTNPLFNGVPTCPYYEFDRNGLLLVEGYYVNGEKNGVWKEYYSNGQIYREKRYENGKLIFPYYYWDSKATKYAVGGEYNTANGIIINDPNRKVKVE